MSLRILINHLTRMRSEYCIAGIDIYNRKHIRPRVFDGIINKEHLEENSGLISLGSIINIENIIPESNPPQTENISFKMEDVKFIRKVPKSEFWYWLSQNAKDSLDSLFPELIRNKVTGSAGVLPKTGNKSLGVFKPTKISMGAQKNTFSFPARKLRLNISDEIEGNLNLICNDYRFYEANYTFSNNLTFTPNYDLFERTIERFENETPLLSLGLTKLYNGKHWLQINNIYFESDSILSI